MAAKKILVIDDERSIRSTLTDILTNEGYKVTVAENGEEGLRKFQDGFDVVMCDVKMPKMDGNEFLEKAKAINPDTPIIIISGHGNIELAVEAVKRGAFDYLPKPPDLNRLLITLRNATDKTTLVAEAKTLKKKIGKVQEMIGDSRPSGG